ASANTRASKVFAVPGTPSSSTWPSESSATSIRSRARSWPISTLWTSPRSRSVISRIAVSSIGHLLSKLVDRLRSADRGFLGAASAVGLVVGSPVELREHVGLAPRRRHLRNPALERLRPVARQTQAVRHRLLRGAQIGRDRVVQMPPVQQQI